MLRLKLLSVINVITFSLSLAFVLTAKEAQTVTISELQLGNRQEIFKKELLTQLKQQQDIKISTQLVAQRQERLALVIGNGAYQEDPLANPINDANDVAEALQELGFKVTLIQNKDLRGMEDAIENFSRELRQGGVGVFYYAGHGVQVNGENYLVPLKAKLTFQKDTRYEAVPLGKVLNAMEYAQTSVNIVIIDACRDNPFYRKWRSRSRGSGTVRGLAPVQSARGTLISFATAPGEVAEDGEGTNSPFTSNLLRHIKTPNLPVELMFKQVRAGVEQETNREQTPWEQSSLVGEFSFFPMQEQPTPLPQTSTDSNTATVTQPTSSIIDSSEPETILISKTTGVDYSRLSELLAARKWKEADQETTGRMLQAAGKQGWWLKEEDLNKFPCEDLRIIDRLWLDASQGKFGFSVQKEIWQKNGSPTIDWDKFTKNWRQFYIDVGWKTEESGIESHEGYVSYDSLGGFTDMLTSKKGNLPNLPVFILFSVYFLEEPSRLSWEAERLLFFSRAANCNL